jgi:charged multivesicular body protein 6
MKSVFSVMFGIMHVYFRRAKLLLRKKRYQESILQKTDNQLENMEKLTHDIEFAQVELQVINGLKQGNEALKKVNESLNIEDIEKILDETREGVEKQEVGVVWFYYIN